MPIILKVSAIKLDFIDISIGESVTRDGLRLTSMSHGLRSESIRMSNPNTSKQFDLKFPFFFKAPMTWFSPQRMVLIQIS